jgi:hypothetical protein
MMEGGVKREFGQELDGNESENDRYDRIDRLCHLVLMCGGYMGNPVIPVILVMAK